VKIHVQVDRCPVCALRGEVDVSDLLSLVVKVIAVDVEKRIERRIQPLAGEHRRGGYPVLAVDLHLHVRPVVFRAVVDRQPATVKLKRIDFL